MDPALMLTVILADRDLDPGIYIYIYIYMRIYGSTTLVLGGSSKRGFISAKGWLTLFYHSLSYMVF